MKVHVNRKVTNYNGVEFTKTYRDLIILSLNGILPDETLSAEHKKQLFTLSKKIFSKDEIDLDKGEIEIILKRAGRILKSPLALGRLIELLDTPEPPKKKK